MHRLLSVAVHEDRVPEKSSRSVVPDLYRRLFGHRIPGMYDNSLLFLRSTGMERSVVAGYIGKYSHVVVLRRGRYVYVTLGGGRNGPCECSLVGSFQGSGKTIKHLIYNLRTREPLCLLAFYRYIRTGGQNPRHELCVITLYVKENSINSGIARSRTKR